MRPLLQMSPLSRRKSSRVEAPAGVQVYWSCAGRSDILPVRNLSFGGVFVETRQHHLVGAKADLDFLVEDGQIRTKAVVRHIAANGGIGLQFTAVAQEDRQNLAALLSRLRGASRSGAELSR